MLNNFSSGLRQMAKTIAFTALGNGPLLRRRLQALSRAGRTTILNLHRVAPDDGSDYRPLDPGLFDELLSFVKREFAVVTISELAEQSTRPKLVLSFDDGYRDFVINAMPILAKHGLRANQNIIPKCVDSGLPPLNVLAQDFVGKAPRELVERLQIKGFSAQVDVNFGRRLSRFLKMRPQAEQDQIATYLLPQFYDWGDFEPTPMMTLEEIRSLGNHELGAHSYAHSSMEYETDEYLDADVQSCVAYFKDKLAAPMSIYAFPNGSCRAGQAEQVLAHGVDHVLLVGEKFDEGECIHTRFTFDGRSRSEIKFKALGGISRL
ncbi:polysaccharide deacetylase family protein [Haliscomenobacter sp.]|uniref:polysaccharide deacetylase family protein n=1 Tax=Haliscomenobacter sp. TaxID=2717303 RepID=UPI003364D1A5